jgi:REP element-mobilizing transposase RayT
MFCKLLREGVARFDHRIYAFCLMPNHVHLVVHIFEITLSKTVQDVAFRYAGWINHYQKRTGHLFQGRFKNVLVNDDDHLLTLIRYVHLNPVRAKITTSPAEYPWSSHRAYVTGSDDVPWLSTGWILDMFGESTSRARYEFEKFVTEDIVENVASKPSNLSRLNQEIFSVAKPTVPALEQLVCSTWELPSYALRNRRQTQQVFEARGAFGWLATKLAIASLTDVAAHVNRDRSTLSTVVGRFDRRLRSSKHGDELAEKLHRVLTDMRRR